EEEDACEAEVPRDAQFLVQRELPERPRRQDEHAREEQDRVEELAPHRFAERIERERGDPVHAARSPRAPASTSRTNRSSSRSRRGLTLTTLPPAAIAACRIVSTSAPGGR